MHPFLRKLWQNEFFKNVTTLLTGTGLAQLVSILIYLVISRFYSEEDFGVFGLYMNILNITILFSTAKYELRPSCFPDPKRRRFMFWPCAMSSA
ncbi:MAG: hypothetical protein R2751_06180 [Bacteroidales bacterium]